MEKLTNIHKEELSQFIDETERTNEEIKRAQAILLLIEDVSDLTILSLTGLKRITAVRARKRYMKNGIDALISKRKYKKPRDLLTRNQRAELQNILHTKTPQNYGWKCIYWTPYILGRLILELYKVKYKSKTSLHLIFKQSKFTYHKPEKIYKKHNQESINAWKQENAPILIEAFNDPDTVVLVEDEMIVTSQTTLQRVWLLEGSQPKIECSNVRKRRSFYGFLDIKTGEQIAFKSDKQTSEISAKFLKIVLGKYKGKKVLLFWDNAPWHKGEKMREFLETCSNFKIINFPPYAPEENPQEHVWKEARKHVTHNTFIGDIDTIARLITTYLNNTIFKFTFFGFKAF
jgi:transposase